MKYYQELTLIDQAEISPYFIWSKIYGQLHIGFVDWWRDAHKKSLDELHTAFADNENAEGNIPFGVSFPEYAYDDEKKRNTLGKKLRVFSSSESQLKELNLSKWLERFADYIDMESIQDVPEKIYGYAVYKRKHIMGNPEKLARRYAKRHKVAYEEALTLYKKVDVAVSHLPYIQMTSLTNNHRFKLFIEKLDREEQSQSRAFTSYGLSSGSLVPEF